MDARMYDRILKKIGFGKHHALLMIVNGGLMTTVMGEILGIAILMLVAKCDLDFSTEQTAKIMGATSVGIMISSYGWGYACDMMGRRKILIYSMYGVFATSLLSLFSNTYKRYLIMRIMIGIFLAGPACITPSFLGEFCSHIHRPTAIAGLTMFGGMALFYVTLLALLFKSCNFIPVEFIWRLISIFNLLPAAISLILLIWVIPPSPCFSLSQNRKGEAHETFRWLCSKKKQAEIFPFLNEIFANDENFTTLPIRPVNFGIKRVWKQTKMMFFNPDWATTLMMYSFITFGLYFISMGLGLLFPNLMQYLNEAQLSDGSICEISEAIRKQADEDRDTVRQHKKTEATDACKESSLYFLNLLHMLVVGVVFAVSHVICCALAWYAGRKKTILGSLMTGLICGLLLIYIDNVIVAMTLFCMYFVLPAICSFGFISGFMDLLPTYHRGKGVCIGMMCGGVGTFFGIIYLRNSFYANCLTIIKAFNFFIAVCIVACCLLPLNESDTLQFAAKRSDKPSMGSIDSSSEDASTESVLQKTTRNQSLRPSY